MIDKENDIAFHIYDKLGFVLVDTYLTYSTNL